MYKNQRQHMKSIFSVYATASATRFWDFQLHIPALYLSCASRKCSRSVGCIIRFNNRIHRGGRKHVCVERLGETRRKMSYPIGLNGVYSKINFSAFISCSYDLHNIARICLAERTRLSIKLLPTALCTYGRELKILTRARIQSACEGREMERHACMFDSSKSNLRCT